MNTIGSALDLSTLGVPQPDANQTANDLGQEDFLMLMITQFRNQDPFEPMENGEFLGQLAQFSTVSGIEEMSASVGDLSDAMYASQVLQAANMVGRQVLASGNVGTLADEGSMSGALDLPVSGNAKVQIFDAVGQLVRELPLGRQAPGTSEFEWDGLASNGDRAPSGLYRVSGLVQAGDQILAAGTLVNKEIQSVSLSGNGAAPQITTTDGQELGLAEVKAIR